MTYKLILLLPLLGSFLSGIFAKQLGEKLAMLIPTALVTFCACLSSYLFFADLGKEAYNLPLFNWVSIGDLTIEWGVHCGCINTHDASCRNNCFCACSYLFIWIYG